MQEGVREYIESIELSTFRKIDDRPEIHGKSPETTRKLIFLVVWLCKNFYTPTKTDPMAQIYQLRLNHFQSIDQNGKANLLHADKILANLKLRLRNYDPPVSDDHLFKIITSLIANSSAELENKVDMLLQAKINMNVDERHKITLLQEVLVEEAKRAVNLHQFDLKNNKTQQQLRLYTPPPEDVSLFKTAHYTIPRAQLPPQIKRNNIHTGTAVVNLAGVLQGEDDQSDRFEFCMINLAAVLNSDSMHIPLEILDTIDCTEDRLYSHSMGKINSAMFAATGIPECANPTQCKNGCGLSGHTFDECPMLRRNFQTGEVMEDFPLHTWKFSQLKPQIREHALLTLRQQGSFAHNGSDEDFNMFCKQVEINAQSIAREKEE
jgi:hypothetical protein